MEEVIEFTYNPPGPKRGERVEVVKLSSINPNRKIPDKYVGQRGKVTRANFGPDFNRWLRVEFESDGHRFDFLTSELKKTRK